MKIAIIGAHAGVHFFSKKLLEEDNVEHVYHLTANSIIYPTDRYTPLNLLSPDSIVNFLTNTQVDMVWITTISYLRDEKIQQFLKEKNIPHCSPSFDLSLLEWSKVHGKALLQKLNIPTAKSRTFSKDELFKQFFEIPRPWVLKFEKDWRAGLQTIIVTDETVNSEFENLQLTGQNRYMRAFGEFVDQVFVVEDFIHGSREYSYHILCNENSWEYLGSARDYKKFGEGDVGTNTASMGCYSPVDINPIVHQYADTILNHLKSQGTPYVGILYLGIMEDANGNAYVLEINTRPGDPEFQSIAMTFDKSHSLSKMLYQSATGQKIDPVKFNDLHSVCLRIVNADYHNIVNIAALRDWEKLHSNYNYNPQLWPELPGIHISLNKDRKLLNSVITTSAESRTQASDKIYNFLKNIEMYDFTFRKDIGYLE
jgi:phosphoribosylamine--glycine ligase